MDTSAGDSNPMDTSAGADSNPMDTSAGATRNNPIVIDEDKPAKPRTVDGIFTDFSGRRKALIRALTTDQDEFFRQCDPAKKALSLYGHESGIWEVMLPTEMLPAELPEPALGINYARDSTNRLHWLSKVAIHADSWLIGVAFYFGQVFLDKRQRMCLFSMMNDLPTVLESCAYFHKYECTCCAPRKMPPSPVLMVSSDNPKKRSRTTQDEDLNINPSNGSRATEAAEHNDQENEDTDQDFCAACGARYNKNGFWICCDVCKQWFHGRCVNMTSAQTEQVNEYKCPDCIREELGE